jgi:hypothetical protein
MHSPVGFGDPMGQIDGKRCDRALDPVQSAHQPYAALVQRPQVEVAVAHLWVLAAYQLERVLPSRRVAVWRVIDRAGETAGGLQPPEDIHASVASRHPDVPTDGKDHLAPGAGQFVGDLHT